MLIIQEISGYFLIGIIGMVILAVCYLPIYLILRKKVPLSRQLAYFFLGVCVLIICSATFLGWIFTRILDGGTVITAQHSLNLIPFQFITQTWAMGTRKQLTQTIANVVMFVPLGFIFPVAIKKARTFWRTTVSMMLFSFLIEFVQYFIGRSADIDDLMLNTLGGIFGYLVFSLFSKLFKE